MKRKKDCIKSRLFLKVLSFFFYICYNIVQIECDKVKNNKGQALIEFIIILPILILVVSCIIDFGNIMYQKYQLTNDLNTIADMYRFKNNNDINNYLNSINAEISYESDENYTTIILKKDIDINTIIVNNIIGKKYNLVVHKTILRGENNG